jgi:hypothetical protein
MTSGSNATQGRRHSGKCNTRSARQRIVALDALERAPVKVCFGKLPVGIFCVDPVRASLAPSRLVFFVVLIPVNSFVSDHEWPPPLDEIGGTSSNQPRDKPADLGHEATEQQCSQRDSLARGIELIDAPFESFEFASLPLVGTVLNLH